MNQVSVYICKTIHEKIKAKYLVSMFLANYHEISFRQHVFLEGHILATCVRYKPKFTVHASKRKTRAQFKQKM